MSCEGQCSYVHWSAVGVDNLDVKLISGDKVLCPIDTQYATDVLLLEATSALNQGGQKTKRDGCDEDCDCGFATAKDEVVLKKTYPYSASYSTTTIKKISGKVVVERTCEYQVSGNVKCEKHRVTAECSPFKLKPSGKKYYMVRSEGKEASVAAPEGSEWPEAIGAALAPKEE